MDDKPVRIVYTLTARCRDCHRCLRVCPVSAISMTEGQASVDPARCIACGACIRQCPQHAKTYRRDIDAARALIASGARVAASIAPAFAAEFAGWRRRRLVSALRKLGFMHVSETAIGAWHSARETAQCLKCGKGSVCTACPAVVNYVEKYRPELVEKLVPVASPMIAHARRLKAKLGDDIKIVFIGPCVAKKSEIARPALAGEVSAALTFEELLEWFEHDGISLENCEESDFDESPSGEARLFPVPGGLLKTAGLDDELVSKDFTAVSGASAVKQSLAALSGGLDLRLEPLFCEEGCINGPGFKADTNIYERKAEIIGYNALPQPKAKPEPEPVFELGVSFAPDANLPRPVFTEEEIQRVLEQTGKGDVEQQLNCGACGYNSCREKAIAVLMGMAVPEMCIPLMRRKAEQRTDKIIETSPNGIMLLNDKLQIIGMNPAFRQMFSCTDGVLGQHVSYLMDAAPFEKVAAGADAPYSVVVNHEKYGLVCRQTVYALPDEKQLVGIFANITVNAATRRKMEYIKNQTLAQAQELLKHQIAMAQEIAKYLGENTAQGEEIVRKLIQLGESDAKERQDL